MLFFAYSWIWNCRDRSGYMIKRVKLIGPDLTRDIQQLDLPVVLFSLKWFTYQSIFIHVYSERGRGQLGEGRTKVKNGKKGSENELWTEGKQKEDHSPKLTQRQNGLLINSGDNVTGIFWPNSNIHNVQYI